MHQNRDVDSRDAWEEAVNRTTVNYAVNWTSFAVIAALSATGLTLEYGWEDADERLTVFKVSRDLLGEIHQYIGIAFLVMIVVHLCLHASWIKAVTLGKTEGGARTRRAAMAIVGLIVALVLYGLMLWTPGGE